MQFIEIKKGYIAVSQIEKVERNTEGKALIWLIGGERCVVSADDYDEVWMKLGPITANASDVVGIELCYNEDDVIDAYNKVPVVGWQHFPGGVSPIFANGEALRFLMLPDGKVEGDGGLFDSVEDLMRRENG